MAPINVMINGLPGRMASETAKVFLENQDRFTLVPYSFSGPNQGGGKIWEHDGFKIQLLDPYEREWMPPKLENYKLFRVVDFTLPEAVIPNVTFYCRNGWPFVLGTTGGDYDEVENLVHRSPISAVVNPNMSIPIIVLQAAFAYAAEQFPGALEGWTIDITESHQKGKADTSGTAKLLIKYFKELGVLADVEKVQKIREPEQQKEMGIPQEYLTGHGYHTYKLSSPDKTVELGLSHNILGRRTYAYGTMKAVEFLHNQLAVGSIGEVFNMMDVLKNLSVERINK